MTVLNYKSLAVNKLRKDALEIIESAYSSIDIKKVIRKRFLLKGDLLQIKDLSCKSQISLKKYKRVFLIGFGKGSCQAVLEIASILKKRLSLAICLDAKGSFVPKIGNKKVKVYWGTHPQPSLVNVKATLKIISLAKKATKDDLVIYFVGGGGSSLLCGSLEELKYSSWLFCQLTQKGATIDEINVVRKHLSLVKGGNLAKITYPAKSISLIVSDVCGNPLDVIASGPTVYDPSMVKDALAVLKKYKISCQDVKLKETPKEKRYFSKCKYFLLACNEDAALAMEKTAKKLGYDSSIVSLALKGEAKKVIFPFLKKIKNNQAMILAGETTVIIKGKGKGGRNQELALSVIEAAFRGKIDLSNTLVASFNSDGFDNTPVAGAIADQVSLHHALLKKLDIKKYLENNDSFNFFQKTGDYLKVERKYFNVSDLILILKSKIK